MAAFAYQDHPQQTMASNDFTLFPQFDWTQDQSFIPSTTYQDQAFLQPTTFDSAYPQLAYASQPQPGQYQFNTLQQQYAAMGKIPQHPPSPTESPAVSASNSFDCPQPNFMSSVSESGASVQSTISSAMASPSVLPQRASDWRRQQQQQPVKYIPSIVQSDDFFVPAGLDFDAITTMDTKGCVDPSLIQPFSPQFAVVDHSAPSPHNVPFAAMPSPAPSVRSGKSPRVGSAKAHWQPYPSSRRQSISSVHSKNSQQSASSDDSNKGLCPIPSCGRQFKDLKAHMLTHQETRPEKCPIPTCEYHIKGFARKYDKNRHTLTHYKGTMVCGFCPGSGSAVEKSFNRADVFKRHLTSVHGVEQTPPNARRKATPPANMRQPAYGDRAASGMCSTCNNVFTNPQDFYEHLDDCVLRVVQQEDPCEAVNARLLSSIANDQAVKETLERHMLSTDVNGPTSFDDEEDDDDEDDDDNGTKKRKSRKSGGRSSTMPSRSGPRRGLTFSKGGVSLAGGAMSGKGNKRRKHYPLSWGAAPEKMRMKKRVLCVYDGQRRLWKDDMMLDANHEVRIPLPGVGDGRAWVSDLDVCTMQRAQGLHNATEEEKGPWIPDEDLEALMK